jgi:four helix bundle protein
MRAADYKDLRVYRLAFESAMEIFELSRRWPVEERFSLTDQIRRSSRSVCTNIAEAWRKRRYEAAFVSKLSDSDGEAAETEVHLQFAARCGYLPADQHSKLSEQYDHICRQLTMMMNDAPSWRGTGCELREMPAEYFVESSGLTVRVSERRSVEASERGSVRYDSTPCSPAPDAPDAPRSRRSP